MRLFVAVWPPTEVVEQLRLLPRPDLDTVRWTTEEQWHATLAFLGEVGDPAPAQTGLAHLDQDEQPTVATAGPATRCFGRRVLQVPVHGLEGLAGRVRDALEPLGELAERDRHREATFRGHLTLARARGRDRRADLRFLAGEPFAASWGVEEVTLVASMLHPKGARYEVLETVAIPAPPDAPAPD